MNKLHFMYNNIKLYVEIFVYISKDFVRTDQMTLLINNFSDNIDCYSVTQLLSSNWSFKSG